MRASLKIRLCHPQTALKLQFIPALIQWTSQEKVKATAIGWEFENAIHIDSWSLSSSLSISVNHLFFLTFSHSTNHYSLSNISHGSELRTNSSSSSPWKQWDNSRFPGVTGGWASQSFFPSLSLSRCYSRSSTFCTQIPSGDPASMHT